MIWGNRRATVRTAISVIALGWAWSAVVSAGPAVSLSSIRHSSSKDRTRVVIDLTAKLDYSHRVLQDPPRVVIDLPQGTVGQAGPRTVQDGFVKTVRLDSGSGGKLQVVLDLEKPSDYAVFTLTNPFRIVVDVKHGGAPAMTPPPTPS